MTKEELRTLRAQLLLTGGLMLLCAVCAVVVATQRRLVERWVREKYTANYNNFPARIQKAADEAAKGTLSEEVYRQAAESVADLDALYDDWMRRTDPPRDAAPAALVRMNSAHYLERAERTLVCGDAQQQQRAARFLELSGAAGEKEIKLVQDVAQRVRTWAQRRRRESLAEQMGAILEKLKDSEKSKSQSMAIRSADVDV